MNNLILSLARQGIEAFVPNRSLTLTMIIGSFDGADVGAVRSGGFDGSSFVVEEDLEEASPNFDATPNLSSTELPVLDFEVALLLDSEGRSRRGERDRLR